MPSNSQPGYEPGVSAPTRRALFDLRQRLVSLEEDGVGGGGSGSATVNAAHFAADVKQATLPATTTPLGMTPYSQIGFTLLADTHTIQADVAGKFFAHMNLTMYGTVGSWVIGGVMHHRAGVLQRNPNVVWSNVGAFRGVSVGVVFDLLVGDTIQFTAQPDTAGGIVEYRSQASIHAVGGTQGPRGQVGPQGPTGPAGPTGPTGMGGFTFSQDAKPTATAIGQTWYETDTGISHVWTSDGTSTQWVQFAPGGGTSGFTYAQDTKPTAVHPGETWFETDTAKSFVWTSDGNSSQWVQFAPGDGSPGGSGSPNPRPTAPAPSTVGETWRDGTGPSWMAIDRGDGVLVWVQYMRGT